MKKLRLINKWLIGLLLFSLLIPAGMVEAGNKDPVRETGTLTVHKYEREPGADLGEEGDGSENQTVPNDAVPLPDVEFTLKQVFSYDPHTDTWTEITGGPTFVGITDGTGKYTFNNLPLGRYTVEETDGPPHVNLNDETFFVDLPMTSKDGMTVNYDVHIYPKNEIIRGAVELQKIDGGTEVPLADVTFRLYAEDGTYTVHVTDDDGFIRVDGLAYGDYYFKEMETVSGYVLGDQEIEFSITASGEFLSDGSHVGEVVGLTAYNYKEPDIEKDIDESAVNRGEIVTYTLTIELPKDISSYNSFVVTDVLDARLSYVDESWQSSISDVFHFEQDNQTLTWTVTDFDALGGSDFVTITFQAKVAEDAEPNEIIDNTAIIEFENQFGNEGEKESNNIPLTPTAGNITIIKQDGDDHNIFLEGAVFELRDENDLVVASGTTDANGMLTFNDVDYGNYTLVETKAPDGYNKLINPIEITVNAEFHDETYNVYNYKSLWHLPRTGGIGTIPFTILGLLIMGSAVFLYVRRRKQTA